MMQTSELRRGNCIEGGIVSHLKPNLIVVNGDTSIRPINASSIRLTPEVLKKAGFIKWVEYWHFQGFKLWHDGKGFYHINSELLVHIDTLHHLQNLFYALTQTELEVEL